MFHVKHIKGDIQMNEAKTLVIRGNLVDIINRRTFGAEIFNPKRAYRKGNPYRTR